MPSALPSTTPGLVASPTPSSEMAPYRDRFFIDYGVNPYIEANIDPLSTFALDVDTGSYTFGRGEISKGLVPPKESVRTEEYLNALSYHYPQPASGKFAMHTELAPSYFGDENSRLLRIGIQGKEILEHQRRGAVLTYVIDVSGSMNQANRLELVKQSLRYLLTQLRPTDKIGIVIYGTDARVALEHTAVQDRTRIAAAIDSLRPEGSTNVEAGLSLGYQQASKVFQQGLVNRVILCSDGVANVGETGPDAIIARIKRESENGITLTTLGFGMGEYNDALMEQLANQGDGQYAYIDNQSEAQRLFGADLTSTLQIIAKDAKIQVSFNGEKVDQYRLLGYENRDIADKDFRNDRVDAGEIGSNHSVTALYELRLKPDASNTGELASVTLRYKDVDDLNRIQELSQTVKLEQMGSFRDSTPSFRLATAVGEFAEILRGSVFARTGKLDEVLRLAQTVQTEMPTDNRVKEFVTLVEKAARLQQPLSAKANPESTIIGSPERVSLPKWEEYLLKQLGGKAAQ